MASRNPIPAPVHAAPGVARVFGGTHQGRVRPINEDRFLVREADGLFAVADGMGGHAHGDVASSAIVAELSAVALPTGREGRFGAACGAIDRANGAIRDFSRELGTTVGSTVVLLSVHEGSFLVAWCGDSRAYLVRGGNASPLTRDHVDPDRDAGGLVHAIGVTARPHLDRTDGTAEPGDAFVLCSDGLTAHVEPWEIATVVSEAGPEAACRTLVRLALGRGGSDNVTVVVIAMDGHA